MYTEHIIINEMTPGTCLIEVIRLLDELLRTWLSIVTKDVPVSVMQGYTEHSWSQTRLLSELNDTGFWSQTSSLQVC